MLNNWILANPTLAIKTSSSAVVKHSAFQYVVNGVLKVKTAGDAPALSGTIADDYSKVCALYITADGTLSWDYSESVALADDIEIKKLVQAKRSLDGAEGILVGWVIITNETGSTFTGGTTALDTVSLTVYYHNAFGILEQWPVFA